jgi:organic hydroperoxide reductase OsmC/OhrA
VHRYEVRCEWRGSTGAGYEDYGRAHTVAAPPADTELTVSSDAAFLGDSGLLNPEQLLVAAASSCQLLSFLAVAARARIDVLRYSDRAEGTMDESDEPARIGRIVLRPEIVVAPGTSEERVRRLVKLGHEHCYIANSLLTEVEVEPAIEVRAR